MTQPCQKPVQPNPFASYRDPFTGQWLVVKSGSTENPAPEINRSCQKGLRPNLCQTYREPQTGRWLVRLCDRPAIA